MTADDVVRLLQLHPHPVEGGYFRETYRSTAAVPAHNSTRNVSTAIYYLLKPGHVSELHVLPGDEVFHFYLGSPVRMLQLHPDGTGRELVLGTDLAAGQVPQLVVPGGVWQGTKLVGDSGFALAHFRRGAAEGWTSSPHDPGGVPRIVLNALPRLGRRDSLMVRGSWELSKVLRDALTSL